MPVWLHWRDLDEDAIALLLAAPLFARILFTPVISFAADWSGARRTVLSVLAWGTLLLFLLLWASSGFWQMLLATLLLAFNWTTIMPLIEAVAVSGVRSAGLDYGRVRLWGSGSFILASFACGLIIGQYGAASVLPLLVAATSLMIAGVYLLPHDVAGRASPSPPALRRISLADAAKLAHSPSFLLFLLAASMIQASHALYYAFGTLHWRAQGFADGTIGALWALGVIAEIALFAVSGPILAKWGAGRVLFAAVRRSSGAFWADGLRSAALADGDIAMPARHELWRSASCGDLFPEPSGARGPRRHRSRPLCRGGRRPRSRVRNHCLRASLSGARRRGLRRHGAARFGRHGGCCLSDAALARRARGRCDPSSAPERCRRRHDGA
jgi:MFS family permease